MNEIVRRFLLHLLPRGLVRIRNFGFLTNRCRASPLPICFEQLRRSAEQATPTRGGSATQQGSN